MVKKTNKVTFFFLDSSFDLEISFLNKRRELKSQVIFCESIPMMPEC